MTTRPFASKHVDSTGGDLSSGCASAGSHFNPSNEAHGAPTDASRHVGDLGNILSDAQGEAKFTIEDPLVTLNGPLSVVGYVVGTCREVCISKACL